MNENQTITPFAFDDQLVRTHLDEEGNPWFVAKDVAKILDIQNIRQNLDDLDEDEKADVCIIYTSSNGVTQGRTVNTINESGLYSLVFRSRKPEAKAFSKWVRSEVLPSLRKAGTYAMPQASSFGAYEDRSYMAKIKIAIRVRLLVTAQNVVNMQENGTAADVEELFYHYCRLMVEGLKNQTSPLQLAKMNEGVRIRSFIEERLEKSNGNKIQSSVLYSYFLEWYKNNYEEMPPSQKAFGNIMGESFERVRKGGLYYYKNVDFVD